MKVRELGRQGLKVSELGLGCMGLSDFYSSSGVTEAQAISLIQRALALGVTFLDTRPTCTAHLHQRSHRGQGAARQARSVVLATKDRARAGRHDLRRQRQPGLCACRLRGVAAEETRRRRAHRLCTTSTVSILGVSIDRFRDGGAMAQLVTQGKVRGISGCPAVSATLRRGHKVHLISALQTEYLCGAEILEEPTLLTVRELGIGFAVLLRTVGLPHTFLRRFRKLRISRPTIDIESPRFQGENFLRRI